MRKSSFTYLTPTRRLNVQLGAWRWTEDDDEPTEECSGFHHKAFAWRVSIYQDTPYGWRAVEEYPERETIDEALADFTQAKADAKADRAPFYQEIE